MFSNLIELSAIIARYGLRLDVFGKPKNGVDAAAILFEGLREDRVHTDAEAASYLRANNVKLEKDGYVVAKSRLKKRMFNSIMFLDLRSETNSEQTIRFFQLQRRLLQTKILLRLGGERNVLSEARKGYALSMKHELTSEALEFAIILRGYYSRAGDVRHFERFRVVVDSLTVRYTAELSAIAASQRFLIHYVKRLSYAERTPQLLESSLRTVAQLNETVRSPVIVLIYYRLQIYSHDIHADYAEVYRVASEAVAYLERIPAFATKSDIAEFAMYQLSSCIYTHDLEKGLAASTSSLSLFPEGTFNWFIAKDCSFVFYMQHRYFDAARTTLGDVLGHRNYLLLPEYQQQRWKVYELFLLFATGELRHMLSKKTKRSVALRELLSSADEIKGDRAGFGFSIRLIYILYLIEKGSFDELTESIESFRTFASRYIKPSMYPRSSTFAKLIALVERYSYNYLVVKTKAQKYLDRLSQQQVSHTEANENIQILPYELIWEMVLESLRKHHRIRRRIGTNR